MSLQIITSLSRSLTEWAGRAGNEEWRENAPSQAFNQEPYYLNAKLKVRNFATSGNWVDTNCGSNASSTTFGTNGFVQESTEVEVVLGRPKRNWRVEKPSLPEIDATQKFPVALELRLKNVVVGFSRKALQQCMQLG